MIRIKPYVIWTDELVEKLKEIYVSGLSASECARYLGHGITRNAVIGKVHRLGLVSSKPYVRKENPMPQPKPKYTPEATEMEKTAYDAAPALDDNGKPYTVLTITDRRCHWISGQPSSTAAMCGHPVVPGTSWCSHHKGRFHQPQQYSEARQRQAEKTASAAG